MRFSCSFILALYLRRLWPCPAHHYSRHCFIHSRQGKQVRRHIPHCLGHTPALSRYLLSELRPPSLLGWRGADLYLITSHSNSHININKTLMTSCFIIAADDISADCFWTVRHYGILVKHFHDSEKKIPSPPGINECASYLKRRVIGVVGGGICGAASAGRAQAASRDPVQVSLSLTWRVETRSGALANTRPARGRRGGGNNYFWIIRPWCMLLCPVITRSQGSRILNELLLWLHNDNWVYPPALFVPLWWSDDSAFLHWSPRYLLLLIWYFILAPVFVLWIWILTVILLPRASNAHLINRKKTSTKRSQGGGVVFQEPDHWLPGVFSFQSQEGCN